MCRHCERQGATTKTDYQTACERAKARLADGEDPEQVLLDAGLRDNFGIKLGAQYILSLKDWIEENTKKHFLHCYEGCKLEFKYQIYMTHRPYIMDTI